MKSNGKLSEIRMTTSFSKFLLFAIFMLIGYSARSQHFELMAEPDITLNYDPDNRWSYNFEIANRNLAAVDDDGSTGVQHVEISHFTSYEVGFYSKLSLGIRYRFREMFDESRHDEVRITEQFGLSKNYNRVKVAHRWRFEQRLRGNTTFRTRYRFSVQFPLNGDRVDASEFFMVGDTEALWSLGKYEKPDLEHRFGLALGNKIFQNTNADVGLEYRLGNYLLQSEHSLFITAGLTIDL